MPAWAITSTDTLPKGVRAFAFVYANAPNVSSTFNPAGGVESLTRPLNRSVTMDDLESAEPRLKTLRSALNSLSPQLLGEQVITSNLNSNISINEKRYVTALLWGFTPTFSAGFILPYIRRDVTSSFRVDTTNNAAALKNFLGPDMPEIADALEQIHNLQFDTNFYENTLFRQYGYEPPRSYTATGFGDLELETRWQYFKSERAAFGLRSNLKLPTATHEADPKNLLDRDFGDRTYQLRLGSVHSFFLVPGRLTLQSGIFGTYRAPTKQTFAIARSPEQILPDRNDPYQIEEVKKELGSQIDTDIGFNLDFAKGAVSLFTSYQYLWKDADRYSGNRNLDYDRLSLNTKIRGQTWESGVELSSVPLYLAQQVPVPAKLIATWVQPVAGKNALYAAYGRLDAILFF